MWEGLVRAPRGRVSLRNFIMLVATLLVTCFTYIFIAAPTTYAQDASWSNDQKTMLTYEDQSYNAAGASESRNGLEFPDDADFYFRNNSSTNGGSPNERWIIYFASNTDPPSQQTATFVKYSYNSTSREYSNPRDEAEITISNPSSTSQSNTQTSSANGDGELTSCEIEGVGWIVCPMTRHIAKAMDYIYDIISDFLEVKPLETARQGPLYIAWEAARNIANILFIVGFLVLIYAQVTGGLLNNYTIKKILPRVIIAAVLVNLSYWICAIGVDISNILGYAVQDMFISLRNSLTGVPMEPIKWENATELILTGGTATIAAGVMGAAAFSATGGSIIAAVYLLVPALVGVILAALVALIVLAMRQALITILIILAPLAFVAYLLPNTEKWFERWRQTFMTMLLLFPIFSVIFGGSQLAGTAIIQTAASPAIALLGMVVMVAPLVITPMVVKFSGSLLGRIAGMVNNPNKGLIDRTRNMTKSRAELHRDKNLARPNTGVHRFGAGRVARRMKRSEINREKRHEGYKKEVENRAHEWEAQRFNRGPQRLQDAVNRRQERKEYGYWDAQYKDADLRHKEIHGQHDSHYWAATQNAATGSVGARRRAMAESAHISEGQAKQYQEAVTNSAENQLQRQIMNNYHGLGDAKTEAVIQSGLAANAKKLSEAQATLALRQVVATNEAYRTEVIMATRNEKQAAEYETIVQKAAEAAYDSYAKTNSDARTLKLQAIEATDSAKLAEQQITTLIKEVQTQGSDHEVITSAQDIAIADAIKQTHLEQDISTRAQQAAERTQTYQMAAEYKESEELRIRAAGIGGEKAANLVYAQAFNTMADTWNKDVKAEQMTLSRVESSELLDRLNDTNLSAESLSAIAGTVASRKHRASQIKLIEKLGRMHQQALADGDNERLEVLRDVQQQVDGDKSGVPFGMGANDQGELARGEYSNNIMRTTRERIMTNFSAEVMSTIDPDELQLMYEMDEGGFLSDEQRTKIIETWDAWQADRLLSSKIQDKHRNILERIKTGDRSSPINGLTPPSSTYNLTNDSFR